MVIHPARVFSHCPNKGNRKVLPKNHNKNLNVILLQTRLVQSQPLVNNDCALLKRITNKVMVIFQTWLLTILESFLNIQMRKKESLTQESSQTFECAALTLTN